MTFNPLLTAGLELALNHILYRDRSLKAARQRLAGRSLALELAGFSRPVTLLFSEQQLDVISTREYQADCTVRTRISTLKKLRDRQQLTALIRSGELDVAGDLQVVQHFSALIDMAELEPAEYLAPWLGDVVAHGVSQGLKTAGTALARDLSRRQRYFSAALTEEWRLAPGRLEAAWFAEEVDAVTHALAGLQVRLSKLEAE